MGHMKLSPYHKARGRPLLGVGGAHKSAFWASSQDRRQRPRYKVERLAGAQVAIIATGSAGAL